MKTIDCKRDRCKWVLDDGSIYGAYLTPSRNWAAYRQLPGQPEEQLSLYSSIGDFAAMVYSLEPQQVAMF